MKLSECKHGILVRSKEDALYANSISSQRVGMIIGITNNRENEDSLTRQNVKYAIPLVQWSCGKVSGIHYNNIEPYKE